MCLCPEHRAQLRARRLAEKEREVAEIGLKNWSCPAADCGGQFRYDPWYKDGKSEFYMGPPVCRGGRMGGTVWTRGQYHEATRMVEVVGADETEVNS